MSDVIPNIFLIDQAEKKVDFVQDEMKIAFMSGTYDECGLRETVKFSDIQYREVSASNGYIKGGLPVYGKTLTVNTESDELIYDMDDVYVTISGGTFGPTRYGVVYDLDNEDHLIYIFDFGEDKTVNDGAKFKIKIDDSGLMKAKQM